MDTGASRCFARFDNKHVQDGHSTCFVLPDAFDNDKQHAFSVTASEVVIMYEDRKGGKYQKSINPS